MEKTFETAEKNIFRFAFTAGTKLNGGEDQLRQDIAAAAQGGLDCLIHGGGVLTGGNPKYLSMRILKEEYEAWSACAGGGAFLPVQGETDGWRSERYLGQIVWRIMTDSVWHECTAFVDGYPGAVRPEGRPYYYVDFEKARVRVIVLCSYFYEIDEEAEMFEKYTGFSLAQRRWLLSEALSMPEGYTALIVSHAVPGAPFDGKLSLSRLFSLLAPMEKLIAGGVRIAGWLTGGYAADAAETVRGVNLISRNMEMGTAFDLCELDTQARTLTLFRQGVSQTVNW